MGLTAFQRMRREEEARRLAEESKQATISKAETAQDVETEDAETKPRGKRK